MCAESSKGKSGKAGSADLNCCAEYFSGMFGKMSTCFGSGEKIPDCSEMMKGMMKTCCGPESGKASEETDRSQEP